MLFKKTWGKPLAVILLLMTLAIIYFNGKSPTCYVRVRGNLLVRSQFFPFNGQLKKMSSVPLKIKVKTANSSATEIVMTGTEGEFEHGFRLNNYAGKSCQVNKFSVESSFVHGEKLSITQGDWDIVKTWDLIANEKSHQCLVNDCFLGDLIFEAGGKNSDGVELGDQINYEQADIWWVSMFLINEVEKLGFPFRSKLAIAYPFDEWNSQVAPSVRRSYANPVTRQVQVVNELFTKSLADMLYHEIGHIWSYDYSTSAMDLVSYFFFNSFDTHGMLSSKSVAFYEGFAQTFGEVIYQKLLFNEGMTPGTLEYRTHYSRRSFLYPLALQNYTFSHEKIFGVNNYFNDPARLFSWAEDKRECVHDQEGTFDCSDPGWISFFSSLLLENHSEGTFDREGANSLINFDLTQDMWVDGIYFNVPREDLYQDQGCRARPKLSFSDLLRSLKGDEDEPFISASEMSFKDYLARLKRMELGNIRNNPSGEMMLDSFQRTFDISNKDAGSFYQNFCNPGAYIYSMATTNSYPWYFREDNKAQIFIALKMHVTEEVNDLVSVKTRVSNNNGKGDVSIRYASSSDLNEEVQNQTDVIMLNDFDEEEVKILTYEQNTFPTFSLMLPLEENGTFPVTRLKIIPRIGCQEISDFYYFKKGSITGDQDFWDQYNCVLNEEGSINHFENSNGNLDWSTYPYVLELGADYRAIATTILMEDFFSSSSTMINKPTNSVVSALFPSAMARESARQRQVNRVKSGKVKKRPKKSAQDTKKNRGVITIDGSHSRENRESSGSQGEKVFSPELSTEYFEKTYGPEKYFGLCDVQNIGNVNPGGQRTKLKSYLYEGDLEDLLNDREDWQLINARNVNNYSPSDGNIFYENFSLKSPGMLYLERQALLLNKKERVKLNGPIYFICEADSEKEIEELDEVNNISITQVRPAIFYDGGFVVDHKLPYLADEEKEVVTLELIEQSQLVEQLKELIANGEYVEIKEFYHTHFGPNRLETVPLFYQMYFDQNYKN